MKITPTKEDKKRFDAIAQLGCIICGTNCEIHHLTGAGMGQKSSHDRTIGLCASHHRTGKFGHAVHNGTKTFEKNHGSQEELLEKQNKLLRN